MDGTVNVRVAGSRCSHSAMMRTSPGVFFVRSAAAMTPARILRIGSAGGVWSVMSEPVPAITAAPDAVNDTRGHASGTVFPYWLVQQSV